MPPEHQLVSCVVPTFNAARYLPQALASILDQTHGELEVVVVDDGSEDDTLAIAATAGSRVRVVQQTRLGPAATRNRGVQEARGAFLAFLDPDDLWQSDKLELQLRCFEADPALDLCVSHARLIWEPEAAEQAQRLQHLPRASEPVPGFATTTLLARRQVFETVGLFDPDLWFADAVDWFLRAEAAGLKRLLLPEALTLHRMHGRNLSQRREQDSRQEFLRIVKRWADRRRTLGPPSSAEAGLPEEAAGNRWPEEVPPHPLPARLPQPQAQGPISQ
jgi:glycosyltransferase involved in cell wall biosynthesis